MFAVLLPDLPGFCVEQIERAEKGMRITARATSSSACCPDCQQASSRVHSYYTRCLRDLPSSGRPISLLLHVRHFRCPTRACPRKTFAEPLPTSCCPMRNGRLAYERAYESSEKREAGKVPGRCRTSKQSRARRPPVEPPTCPPICIVQPGCSSFVMTDCPPRRRVHSRRRGP